LLNARTEQLRRQTWPEQASWLRLSPTELSRSPMRGSCLCGKVKFEIEGELQAIYQCHCSLCRKEGGSSSNSSTIIDAAKIRWAGGQEYISSYVRQTGFRSDFCSSCGSPVPHPLRSTSYYWVPVGLLDGNIHCEVVAHLFVGSKALWDTIPANGLHFETMPRPGELLKLLNPKN
jgi:hypothetical protein